MLAQKVFTVTLSQGRAYFIGSARNTDDITVYVNVLIVKLYNHAFVVRYFPTYITRKKMSDMLKG